MLKRWINLKNPHSGSCYDKTRNKWYVKITLKKKIYNLGRYDTLVHLPIKSRKLYFNVSANCTVVRTWSAFSKKNFSRKGYRYDNRYLQIMYIFFFYSVFYSGSDKGNWFVQIPVIALIE